jgi:four helix bundle protein
MPNEVLVVTKFYDIMKWLIPQISKLPRSHKFTLGDRIINQGLDILMLLVEANYTRDKAVLLRQANQELEQLRYLLRLCKDLELFPLQRYEHISREINEVGSQIGGWLKNQERGK